MCAGWEAALPMTSQHIQRGPRDQIDIRIKADVLCAVTLIAHCWPFRVRVRVVCGFRGDLDLSEEIERETYL